MSGINCRQTALVSSSSLVCYVMQTIMDGKDYQRGSIERDGNRQRNSETIRDKEVTISRTSYKA